VINTTPAAWRAAGTWITFRGVRLFVNVVGRGPDVLVLHGFPTSSFDFSKVAPLVRDGCRLILFDYPGFGFSDKPRHYLYSLFTYADAAQAVAAHFGLARVPVLCHDIGDSVLLELLRRGQPQIDAIVMLNGSIVSIPFDDPGLRAAQRLLLHPLAGATLVRLGFFNRARFVEMFRKIFAVELSPAELDAFWSLLREQNGDRLYHRLLQYMPERWQHQPAWLAALERHRAPLTLVWGRADPVATPEVAEAIVRLRPDARVVWLEQTGHYPHWERPERVATVLTSHPLTPSPLS
jgi:pimeloyl-ACP methyl ester carboxylesterase